MALRTDEWAVANLAVFPESSWSRSMAQVSSRPAPRADEALRRSGQVQEAAQIVEGLPYD